MNFYFFVYGTHNNMFRAPVATSSVCKWGADGSYACAHPPAAAPENCHAHEGFAVTTAPAVTTVPVVTMAPQTKPRSVGPIPTITGKYPTGSQASIPGFRI